jgi:ATP-binding cassette, subfamily C, bacterial
MSTAPETTPEYRQAMRDLFRGAAAASFVGLFVNLLHLALPLYTIQIYDRVISSGSIDTLVALTVIVAVLLGFQAMLDFLRHRILTILAARIAARLGQPVFEAAVEAALRHGARASTEAMRDLGDLRSFIASGTIALPMDLAVTPLFLAVLFLLNPVYGLIGLAGTVLLTLVALATEFFVRRPSARASKASAGVHGETAGAIRNAEVIAAMGMLPAVAQRWRRLQSAALDSIERGRAVAGVLSAIARTLRIGLQIAIVSAGAVLVIEGLASAGTMIAAAVLCARLLLPFEQLIDGWRQWLDAFAALDRLRGVLARGANGRSRQPVIVERAALAVDRLGFVPPGQDRPVLRNVSFRVEEGELLGVIGPSGAGKSTLARLLVGLWQPTAGGIYLDGQSTFAHERGSFGAAVGYLPQEPMLLDGKVRENIARFRDADMGEVVAAARIAGVHELIGRMPQGYETQLADAGARLSGGQRQRLALARAVFGDPKLIVLDEPNSNLDAEGEAALIEAIEIARARGAAIVVVAQRMSILNRADQLLFLKEGGVAQLGDRAQVLATLGPRAMPRGDAGPLPLRGVQ